MATGNDANTEQPSADLPVLSRAVSQTSYSHPKPSPYPQLHSCPHSKHPPSSSFGDGSDKPPEEPGDGHGDDISVAGSSSSSSDGVDYPEGGRQAWAVVFGSFVLMMAGFGIMGTIGNVQAYLSENQLAHESQGKIGWIFGMYAFVSFFGGILIGASRIDLRRLRARADGVGAQVPFLTRSDQSGC